MWGLRPEEAESRELLSLDIGLPVADIAPKLRQAQLDGAAPAPVHQVTAINRRGKPVDLQIVASPLRAEEGFVSGIIMVIDQKPA